MKDKLKIGILCPYKFPQGMAPTTRIIAYGKGLVQNGHDVEVISFRVLQSKTEHKREGVIEGIKYVHPFFYNPDKFCSKLYRICYANIALIYYCIKTIIKSHHKRKFDCFLLSYDEPRYLIFYSFVLRCLGIKLSFIGDEFPEAIRQLKDKVPPFQIFEYKIAYLFIKKRILMTKALQRYYDNNICVKPTLILSSVIDTKRFAGLSKHKENRDYLCYMGNMMLAKDNVDNIIRAFALIKGKYSNLDLHLYGTPNEKDNNIIMELIEMLNLKNRVLLKGRAGYDEVPQILYNAKILVTSQPATKRAQGGFPTKMCEYMMTDVPTILTDVGEIHEYVTDSINTFMVNPCDPEAYAKKLDYILSNYDVALEVAKQAKSLVLEYFDSVLATKKLITFLNT